jgi:hypothetical protein
MASATVAARFAVTAAVPRGSGRGVNTEFTGARAILDAYA